jgi:hypothetical protein
MLFAASTSRAATAVSACGTLSAAGNYFLTKNLTATGTCIVIGSEGVSLDMRGHSIMGDGSTGDGISDGGGGFESMAIANGTIQRFNVGIGLDTSGSVVIRNVDSSKNAKAGIIIGSCCSTLDTVSANNNGTVGIITNDCCYTLSSVTVTKNGGGGGIVAGGNGCCTTLFNSIVSGNGGAGLFMEGCCSFLIGSLVSGNTGDGVDMNDCCNFVVNSSVSLNMGRGISLIESDNLVSNTDVSSNGSDGIFLGGSSNQIANSKATANGGFGANVGCPGAITRLQAKNNASGGLNTSGGTCTQVNNKIQ